MNGALLPSQIQQNKLAREKAIFYLLDVYGYISEKPLTH